MVWSIRAIPITRSLHSLKTFRVHMSSESPATADICDFHVERPTRLRVVDPCLFQDYGKKKSFSGEIETIRCFESNPLVRETVGSNGNGKVLVVDGGGSKRCAILGDQLATMASENNWSGLVINGCIRDSKVIRNVDVGVKALGTNPVPSIKDFRGEKGGRVTFGGVEFVPGQWLYADEVSVPLPTEDRLKKKNLTQCIANKDGIIISEKELDIDS